MQGGSPLGVKIQHLLCVLQGYLLQGHHALITRGAKARGQPQATLYVEPTVLIPQHSFGDLQATGSQFVGHIDRSESLAQEPDLRHLHRASSLHGLEGLLHLPLHTDDGLGLTANLYAIDL